MPVDTSGMRHWCDSIEAACTPREIMDIPSGETPVQLPEQFLATAIRYLRATCEDLDEARRPKALAGLFVVESEWRSFQALVMKCTGEFEELPQLKVRFEELPNHLKMFSRYGLSNPIFQSEISQYLQRTP